MSLVLASVLVLGGASCFKGRGSGRAIAALLGIAARVAVVAAAAATVNRVQEHRLPARSAIDACPPLPEVQIEGCVQDGLVRPHDSRSACAHSCVDHGTYHAAPGGKIDQGP